MGKLHIEYFLAKRISGRGTARKNNVMVRIATLSVAIGISVMIISLSVIFGFKHEISEKLIGFGSHVQIVNLDGNTSFETVPISKNQPFLHKLYDVKNLTGIYPYAIKAGIMRGEDAMQGVVLKGVDSSYDWTFFKDNMRSGEIISVDSARTKDVLISQALADMMSLEVGDKMEMMFLHNPPRRDRFRVKGIYDTQFAELDKVMVITDIRNVQRLNNWGADSITGFELTTSSFNNLERFTDDVFRVVVENPPVEGEHVRVINIRERYPMIFDWLDAHNVNAAVIIIIMLLVALFNMISALLIILLERTSMIGILKALGMSNRSLQKMFVIRSSFVILKGMLWGNIIGMGLCLLQYYTGIVSLDQEGYFLTTVPIFINWGYLILVNVVTFFFLVALLALPTMIISLILPEKTIRFE